MIHIWGAIYFVIAAAGQLCYFVQLCFIEHTHLSLELIKENKKVRKKRKKKKTRSLWRKRQRKNINQFYFRPLIRVSVICRFDEIEHIYKKNETRCLIPFPSFFFLYRYRFFLNFTFWARACFLSFFFSCLLSWSRACFQFFFTCFDVFFYNFPPLLKF